MKRKNVRPLRAKWHAVWVPAEKPLRPVNMVFWHWTPASEVDGPVGSADGPVGNADLQPASSLLTSTDNLEEGGEQQIVEATGV